MFSTGAFEQRAFGERGEHIRSLPGERAAGEAARRALRARLGQLAESCWRGFHYSYSCMSVFLCGLRNLAEGNFSTSPSAPGKRGAHGCEERLGAPSFPTELTAKPADNGHRVPRLRAGSGLCGRERRGPVVAPRPQRSRPGKRLRCGVQKITWPSGRLRSSGPNWWRVNHSAVCGAMPASTARRVSRAVVAGADCRSRYQCFFP